MLYGLLLSLCLLAGLRWTYRAYKGVPPPHCDWRPKDPRWLRWAFGLAVGAACLPLLPLTPSLDSNEFFGDAMGHAKVSSDLARHGSFSGWIPTYQGGFPFGVHYPPLGWLAASTLIRVGLSPGHAIHCLGFVATIGAPVAFYLAAIASGARAIFACCGAVLLIWLIPFNAFVGGVATFFQVGLLSQVLGVPLCLLMAGEVLRTTHPVRRCLLAALATAAHPQITVALFVVSGPAVLAAGARPVLSRWFQAGLSAGFAAIGLYLPGLLHLEVPFGWPPNMGWRHIGFHESRLTWWLLDGDLLDAGRPALLTALTGTSLAIALLMPFRPLLRGGALALLTAIGLAVSGRGLQSLGVVGDLLLAFLQPLRVMALIPPAAAFLVVVALQEGSHLARARLTSRIGRFRVLLTPPVLGCGVLCVSALALPSVWRFASQWRKTTATPSLLARCQQRYPGFDLRQISQWLGSLRGGRLAFAEPQLPRGPNCRIGFGLDHMTDVPLAWNSVGGHVGVLATAFSRLDPRRPGAAQRARALGVEHVLHLSPPPPEALEGWAIRHRNGGVLLASLQQPRAPLAWGCVVQRWLGEDRALRKHLLQQLTTDEGTDRILRPNQWIALERAEGALVVHNRALRSCSASRGTLDRIRETPGAIRATVTNSAPSFLQLNRTYYRGWKFWLNEQPVTTVTQTAPGFMAVAVPAGAHTFRAELRPLNSQYWAWPLGILGVALTALWASRSARTS